MEHFCDYELLGTTELPPDFDKCFDDLSKIEAYEFLEYRDDNQCSFDLFIHHQKIYCKLHKFLLNKWPDWGVDLHCWCFEKEEEEEEEKIDDDDCNYL